MEKSGYHVRILFRGQRHVELLGHHHDCVDFGADDVVQIRSVPVSVNHVDVVVPHSVGYFKRLALQI